MAILGVVGLALIGALYRPLVAVALDEEAARVSGVPVALLNVLLAGLAKRTVPDVPVQSVSAPEDVGRLEGAAA